VNAITVAFSEHLAIAKMINQSGNANKHNMSFATVQTQASWSQSNWPDYFRIDLFSHHSKNCHAYHPRPIFESGKSPRRSPIKKVQVMEDEDLQLLLRLLSEPNKPVRNLSQSLAVNSQLSPNLQTIHQLDEKTDSLSSFLNKAPELSEASQVNFSDSDVEKREESEVDETRLLSEIRKLKQAHSQNEMKQPSNQLDSYQECFPETADYDNWDGDELKKRKSRGRPSNQGSKRVKGDSFKRGSRK